MTQRTYFACPCGARSEIDTDALTSLDCWKCNGTMRPYTPGHLGVRPAPYPTPKKGSGRHG